MNNKKVIITIIIIISIIILTLIGNYIYKTVVTSNNENIILEDSEAKNKAKNILNKYIKLSNYENNNIGPMPYILAELGLETRENLDLLCDKAGNTTEYIKSNTEYEDFKNELLKYVTEEYFLENFSQYKNIDGYIGFGNYAAGAILLEVEDVKLVSKNLDEYKFEVVFKDVEMYEHYLDGEEITENDYLVKHTIIFKNTNNKFVISEFEEK